MVLVHLLRSMSEVTHKCSWTFGLSLGMKTVTSNLPLPSWCWWIEFLARVACTVEREGALEHTFHSMCASLDRWEHTDVTIRHDQEHALGAPTRLVRERRGPSTYLELAPVASHHSVGATVEWCVARSLVKPSGRTLFETLEKERFTRSKLCASRKRFGPVRAGTGTKLTSWARHGRRKI